jgi:hypothetical protein
MRPACQLTRKLNVETDEVVWQKQHVLRGEFKGKII